MSSARIVIFETGEVFDNQKDLVSELELSRSALQYCLYRPKTWNGLHIYSVPNKEQKCIHCGVSLNNKNQYQFNKKDGYRICKKCSIKQNSKNQKSSRIKNWIGYKHRVLRGAYGGNVTKEELKQLFETQDKCCAICKSKLTQNAHIDHIIPVSYGGLTEIENLQFLCEMCNRGKFNWSQEEYVEHCKKVTNSD